jgi:glycosyltransferase involved in cell wall biosynthesis
VPAFSFAAFLLAFGFVYDGRVPKISAILHTHNDAARIGRVLDSLRPCNEVVVIDDSSDDETLKIARQHGATVKKAVPGVEPGAYVTDAQHDWILCILPNESLGEALEASLLEWKETEPDEKIVGYCFEVREEHGDGWRSLGPVFRLVNRKRLNWPDALPPNNPDAPRLAGELLRFEKP